MRAMEAFSRQTPATTFAELIAEAARDLRLATETPRLDAEILLAHSLSISRARLLAGLREETETPEGFEELVRRRQAREPIAYITGVWEFFSLEFEMQRPVLVPRPETEHLVEWVLDFVVAKSAHILEIGTGSGCVAISIACRAQKCRLVATDTQKTNVELARRNALRHEVEQRIEFRAGHLFDVLSDADTPFDVICSNPPYVEDGAWNTLPRTVREYEDPHALLAGPDGLILIRRLISEAQRFLRPGGLIAFEMGEGQCERVEDLLRREGYADVRSVPDLAGIERIALAKKPR